MTSVVVPPEDLVPPWEPPATAEWWLFVLQVDEAEALLLTTLPALLATLPARPLILAEAVAPEPLLKSARSVDIWNLEIVPGGRRANAAFFRSLAVLL